MSVVESLRPRQGLRVLVTAGASGIGLAIASAFAEAGARVHVCDIDDKALDALPPHITRTHCDVSNDEDVARLFDDASALGGLDVVVNNAGIAGPTAGIEDIDHASWTQTIDINLNGQYRVAHRAAPLLRDSQGLLVNLASVAGRLGFAYRTPYAASKWAVVGLTKSLACELGPEGVRVNAILPGIVRGPRITKVIEDRAAKRGISYEEMETENLSKISMRRMVDPTDIAAMALFLAAPGGSNISGQALSVCANVESL
ncbi:MULTISPECIES: SDR family oxidoreductase [Halomonas]|uniref:SDR family oxidoreductase n=1 Tax=Halomonas TaxID=2745 RepID=UPI001A8EC626|nr:MULTISPECIES: SDR family oxidoreductase [Halomonas]MED5295900.1 SDR family oxidoreductase [Pseudomonadota bacterium]MBN8414406.1 SDR family oxidoreductase [Halomonas litopenaei]MBY5927380.1 SDR family oxidoreductase [Halomonas sp. DP4Y7-2]MBY5929244.1 SDR family oxidoreductase [Halomonas sp. DP8Y7-3]MBY5970622.1 SDR family oxidoreductase [Halomonas denitrificans]